MEFITDLEKLREPSEPLKFISDQGLEKEEGDSILKQLYDAMNEDTSILALAAPVLGINKRIVCIRFEDTIKTFIDPVVIKKDKYAVAPETFLAMPGKEILINRPEEVTAVYYTADYKYEENKLLGPAARLFDQQVQLLDGVLPDELGLVSDVELDGSLADLSEEEIKEVVDFYKQFVSAKLKGIEGAIAEDKNLSNDYAQMKFAEKVIHGDAAVVAEDGSAIRQQAKAKAALKVKKLEQADKQRNKAELKQFLNRKGK